MEKIRLATEPPRIAAIRPQWNAVAITMKRHITGATSRTSSSLFRTRDSSAAAQRQKPIPGRDFSEMRKGPSLSFYLGEL